MVVIKCKIQKVDEGEIKTDKKSQKVLKLTKSWLSHFFMEYVKINNMKFGIVCVCVYICSVIDIIIAFFQFIVRELVANFFESILQHIL